jgi:hypothetical protein
MRLLIFALTYFTFTCSILDDMDLSHLPEDAPGGEEDIDLPDVVDFAQAPAEWCSWFEDVDFRVQGLGISIHADEARLDSYQVLLEVVQRTWNLSAANDTVLTLQAQRVVDGVFERSWRWIRFPEDTREEFGRFLYQGFENLRTQVDADLLNAIVREYAALVIADRRWIEARLASERLQRMELIDTV